LPLLKFQPSYVCELTWHFVCVAAITAYQSHRR